MKNRLKAILLAAGLTVSMFSGSSLCAAEAATEAATETADELTSEFAAEADEAQDASAQEVAGGTYAMYYDTMKQAVPSMLSQLSAMTDEQLDSLIDGTDAASAAVAAGWKNVKEELGAFVEVEDQEVVENGTIVTVNSNAKYDGVSENTKVEVSYEFDMKKQSTSMHWEIKYPMSKLIAQAALNTLMGVAIVFLVLLFLSFLISQMHWIPDLMNRKKNQKADAPAVAAPAAAPVVEEEEELVDDGELIAVIAAAIAASEQTSTDGFVVRSIRRSNRNNWQRA